MKHLIIIFLLFFFILKNYAQSPLFFAYSKLNDFLPIFDSKKTEIEIKKFEAKYKQSNEFLFYKKLLFGDFIYKKSNSKAALNAFFDALKLANNKSEHVFIVNYKIGMFYVEHDDLTSATTYFNKALLQRADTCHNNLDFKIMYQQGLINSYLDNFKTSISYYNKALNIASINGNAKQKAAMLNNIALNYLSIDDSSTAKKYFNNSLSIRLQNKDSIGIGQIYNNLGLFYYQYKFYKLALKYFNLGYAIRKNNSGLATSIIESQINIGKALFELHQYPQCNQIFNAALNESKKLKHLELERRVLEPLIEMNQNNKNYEKAFTYQSRYFLIKDSLYGLDKMQEIKNLSFQFEFNKQQQQDSLAYQKRDFENKKQLEVKEAKNKLLYYILAIIFLALCGCGYFLFKLYKSNLARKQANAVITSQKNELAEK